MPNTHETLSSLFTDIADAIRAKTGGTGQITADNFPSEIAAIPTDVPMLTNIVKCTPEKETVTSATVGTITATYTFGKVVGAKYYVIISQASYVQGSVSMPTDYTQYVALFNGTSIIAQTGNRITYTGEANNQYTFTSSITSSGSSPRARVSLYAYAIL